MSLGSVNMERLGVASGGMCLALSRVSVEDTMSSLAPLGDLEAVLFSSPW